MQQQKIWVPLMASVGIGAAAYCAMTKGGQSVGSTLSQAVPFVSGMSGGQQNAQSQAQPQNQQQMNQPSSVPMQ